MEEKEGTKPKLKNVTIDDFLQTNSLKRDNKAGAMAEEDGSKPKYEVEEISIKTRVQKILDLSTSRWVGFNSPEYDFESRN